MPYRQIEHLLEDVQHFHEAVKRFYAERAQGNPDPRLARVLSDLEERERALCDALARTRGRADAGASKTWLQFDVDQPLRELLREQRECVPNRTVEGVIDLAVRFDHALVGVYERLASSQVGLHVKELFAELAEMQKSQRRDHALRGLDADI